MSSEPLPDSPKPSASAPRRTASSSPTGGASAKRAGSRETTQSAAPRADGRPGFVRKKPAGLRGGRAQNKKLAAAEQPATESGDAGEQAAAPNAIAADAAAAPEVRRPATAPTMESETGGGRQEQSPYPRREPQRDSNRDPNRDSHRDSRFQDRGPRPNRHERPERSDRWERPPPPRQDRMPLDVREISDKAWQLFAAELREEGVTFVDDGDAEKLTNRCFKLAEIFVRHRQRRTSQHSGAPFPEDRRREEVRPPQVRPTDEDLPQGDRHPDEASDQPQENDGV